MATSTSGDIFGPLSPRRWQTTRQAPRYAVPGFAAARLHPQALTGWLCGFVAPGELRPLGSRPHCHHITLCDLAVDPLARWDEQRSKVMGSVSRVLPGVD